MSDPRQEHDRWWSLAAAASVYVDDARMYKGLRNYFAHIGVHYRELEAKDVEPTPKAGFATEGIDFEPTGPGKLPPARYPQAVELARTAEQMWLRKQWDGQPDPIIVPYERWGDSVRFNYCRSIADALNMAFGPGCSVSVTFDSESVTWLKLYVQGERAGELAICTNFAGAKFQDWCRAKLERTKVNALPGPGVHYRELEAKDVETCGAINIKTTSGPPKPTTPAKSAEYERARDIMYREIDGLTHDVIRARFASHQRESGLENGWTMKFKLTPAQLAWAREDWSAQLRAKVQASKERERAAITCEPNYVDE